MRKLFLFLATSALILASCGKEVSSDETPATKLTFNFTVNHPDASTKAVKTGWEKGDVIFVFFLDLETPNYLRMSYDGTSWTNTEMSGKVAASSPFALPESGKLTAVYLPFGNKTHIAQYKLYDWKWVENDGSDFECYSYYLSYRGEFTNEGGVVSATLEMKVPYRYVQFFMEDPAAETADEDEYYTELTEANLMPNGVKGVFSNGNLIEVSFDYGEPLPGYLYKKDGEKPGFLFSGWLLSSCWNTATDYHFTYSRTLETSGNTTVYTKTISEGVLYTSENTGRAVKFKLSSGWEEVTE